MITNLVVYSSETGNTKLLAEEIYYYLPDSMGTKDIVNIRSWNGTLFAENYFIGFWINRGSCSLEIIDLISSIKESNVAFFGTCGLGSTDDYYKMIEQNAKVWLPDSNTFLGSYFCQGRMPMEIRDRYEACRGKCDDAKIDHMLECFDSAFNHPDSQDIYRTHQFVDNCLKKAPKKEFAPV